MTGNGESGTPSSWDTVRVVATREFGVRLRDKSFAISTVITLAILLAVVILPTVLGAGGPNTYTVGLVQPPAGLEQSITQRAAAGEVDITVTVLGSKQQATQAVTAGDVDMALIGADTAVVDVAMPTDLAVIVQSATAEIRGADALTAAGLDPAAVAEALAGPPLQVEALNPADPEAEERSAIAFITVMVLYAQMLTYGFWVAYGVVEEKSSRVIEILLSAVRPLPLLAGKVVGIGLLSLGQLALFGTIAVTAALALDAVSLPAGAVAGIAVAVAFFVLGYAFYAGVFAAVGATVSRVEDLQNLTLPLVLVIVATFLGGVYVVNVPDGALSTVLSLIPPFSTIAMPPLIINGVAAPWQVVLSVLLALAAVALMVRLASRIYLGAILTTGARVPLRNAWRASGARRG